MIGAGRRRISLFACCFIGEEIRMSAEALLSSFTDLGVDVDEESLQECVRVCEERGVEADTLVEAWVAYSLSALDGAAPSVEKVRLLERKEFGDTSGASRACAGPKAAPAHAVYRADAHNLEETDVISKYLTSTTPKRVKHERVAITPSNKELTPATLSPTVHSGKYASRKNAGSVVLSHGEESALKEMDKKWDGGILDIKIKQVPNEDGAVLGNKAMFGFDLLHEMASVFDNQTRYLAQSIMNKVGIKETSSVRCKSQTEVYVAGRVDCDADARLNPQSVLLQGTWEESLSQPVCLDLEGCSQYGLFPGQTVVVRGTNPRGDKFLAQQIYSDATLPLHDHRADLMNTLNGTLTILAASGPYTPSDSMTYGPLKDFVSYVATHKPHVVIMTGPFLDVDHAMVKTPNLMAETYRSFFEKLLDNIAEISVASPHTKLLIVSSLRDAFHQNVFPTPAYRSRQRLPNVTFLPDPCTVDINGISVGVTSTDVLMHLSQEEISLGSQGDKLTRLARYVVSQQCYYPLWSALTAQPCDAGLWASHAHLPHTPHLMLLPSSFRYFAKEVNGCVVVNPEHLTKGPGGGTFAKIQIKLDDKIKNVADGISCQIIRI